MKKNDLILFIEINNLNFIFIVGFYNNENDFEIIEKIISPIKAFEKNKLINIDKASELVKKNVQKIEQKHNFIFKEVILILDAFNSSCINISGFKKLNGSQILKENISYILNSLKLFITENEKDQTILHIFNTKSILDGVTTENLPIGLFGDFYSHELTFFLIDNNDLKNIKKIFNQNNLNIKKSLLKSFVNGSQLINKNMNLETFFLIKISKDKSQIIFFDKSSLRYVENFCFGTDYLYKDISKICSISNKVIEKFLLDKLFNNQKFKENEYLEEKYFLEENFRKIRKKLILDIANARIEEFNNIILNKNINIKVVNKSDIKTFLIIEDELILNNFSNSFRFFFSKHSNIDTNLISDLQTEESIINAANLSAYGWKKEAIPIIHTKNSIITRIFNSIFG
jgi:cell division protein FtsA